MQIVSSLNKAQFAESFVKDALPNLFFASEIEKVINDLHDQVPLSLRLKKRLFNMARPIELHWNHNGIANLLSFTKANWDDLEILQAWSRAKGAYVSHYSALYFNDLVEQRPKDHFITREVDGKVATKSSELRPLQVRQAFLKPARITQAFFMYHGRNFSFPEKISLGMAGVMDRRITQSSSSYDLRITTPERTFLDCVISPHYAGGINTVIKAYAEYSFNIVELLRLYNALSPTYPYWQSIGLILEKTGNAAALNIWRAHYQSQTRLQFYLEREAKQNWILSDEWQVYYPPGVFVETRN